MEQIYRVYEIETLRRGEKKKDDLEIIHLK